MESNVIILAIEEVIDVPEGSLRGNELLRDLENWDSLAFLSFLAMADTRFGIKVTPEQLRACVSVEDLGILLAPKPATDSTGKVESPPETT